MLFLSDGKKGRMVEIATGEGKSCIIAMAAAMLASQGKSVDIVTSSPVLAVRDSDEWELFYKLFELTVDDNVIQGAKNQVYSSDIVYGTVSCFAADILKHEFQLKGTRGERRFDAVLVDEVDFMLLDQGVQSTYLSHKSAGLRHLEPVLCTVWNYVSSQKPVRTSAGDIFITGLPRPFYMAVADVLDPEECKLDDPVSQLLEMAEHEGLVGKGFTNNIMSNAGDALQAILDEVTTETMVQFIKASTDKSDPGIQDTNTIYCGACSWQGYLTEVVQSHLD